MTIDTRPELRIEPTAADIDELTALVHGVQEALNSNDATSAVASFARDSVGVSAVGATLTGYDAIAATHRVALDPGGFLRDQTVEYRIDDVWLVAPDVACVIKSAYAVEHGDSPDERGAKMNGLYVCVRRDGRWWTSVRHNTLVV